MFKALVIFIVIASILMIGIVLIQRSKGGGLSSQFASSNQIMGVRKTNSFVEKATWTLAIVICVLSIASAFFIDNGSQAAPQSRTADAPTQTTAPGNFSTPAAKKEAPKQAAQAPAAAPAQSEAPATK